MTVSVKNIIESKVAEAAATTQYTATNCTTIIDKFTAVNTTATPIAFSAHIVSQGDTPDDTNIIIDARLIAGGESYQCPELVGQVMPPNSMISTTASGLGVTIRASGREVT